MDLSLTEDQELIKGSVEKFIIETYDSESRRKTIKSNLGSDDTIWKQFAELGWLGLPFLEKDGGFGGDFMDLHILMESFGKGLVIEPYISTENNQARVTLRVKDSDPLLRRNQFIKIINSNYRIVKNFQKR